MLLLLEDNDVILMDNIVALVRYEGRTTITSRDNSARESVFTPATLYKRSSRLISSQNRKYKFKTITAADRTSPTKIIRTEDN